MSSQGQKYGDNPKHKKPGKDISHEPIKRFCLKCDRQFTAKGRFNRVCPNCTESNRYMGFYNIREIKRNYAPGTPARDEGDSLRELVKG